MSARSLALPAERFCRQAVVYCLYALIFFLPISIGFVTSFSIATVAFYVLGKAFRWLGGRAADVPHDGLVAPILLFHACVLLCTVFFSQYFAKSLAAYFGKFLLVVVLYLAVAESLSERRQVRRFMGAFAASAVLACVSGIYQHFFACDFLRHVCTEAGRVSSSFRQANDFGAYLTIVLSICLAGGYAYLFSKAIPVRKKAMFAAGAGLALACMGLTYSRSAWICFFIVSLLVAAVYRRVWLTAGCILIFVLAFSPLMMLSRNVSLVTDNVRDSGQLKILGIPAGSPAKGGGGNKLRWNNEAFSGMGRKTFWQEAGDIINSSPWVGTGLNTYSKVAPKFKITWGGYPHNCYLQMAAETGWIGLGSFLILIVLFMWRTWGGLRRTGDVFLKAVGTGIWAGLLGFLIQSGFDTMFYSVQLSHLMWLMMGVLAAVLAIDRRQQAGGSPN